MNKNAFRNYATKHLGINGTLVDDVTKYQVKNFGLSPHVLEERQLNVTQLSVFDRLMMDRILWVSGEVDDTMSDIIQAQLLYLEDSDPQKDITMQINTGGGSVTHGLGIIDVMNYIKPNVATVNLGMCASMGSVLLSSGAKGKRSSLINSTVMLHHVAAGTSGKVDDTRISQMETEKYNFLLFKILALNTDKSFEEIHDFCQRDMWLNSDEALNYGLIDNVIGLADNKSNSITTMMDGFDEYYMKYVFKQVK